MLALFLLFIAAPIAELFLLVRVGRIVGVAPTVGFVVAMGFLGATLAKSQGRRVIRQWQAASAQGEVPEEGVLGGVLVLLGALLMIMPGIVSDVLGLLLMIPALRKRVARALGAYLGRKLANGELRVYAAPGMGGPAIGRQSSAPPNFGPRAESRPSAMGRAPHRAGDVIDTEGEEVE